MPWLGDGLETPDPLAQISDIHNPTVSRRSVMINLGLVPACRLHRDPASHPYSADCLPSTTARSRPHGSSVARASLPVNAKAIQKASRPARGRLMRTPLKRAGQSLDHAQRQMIASTPRGNRRQPSWRVRMAVRRHAAAANGDWHSFCAPVSPQQKRDVPGIRPGPVRPQVPSRCGTAPGGGPAANSPAGNTLWSA